MRTMWPKWDEQWILSRSLRPSLLCIINYRRARLRNNYIEIIKTRNMAYQRDVDNRQWMRMQWGCCTNCAAFSNGEVRLMFNKKLHLRKRTNARIHSRIMVRREGDCCIRHHSDDKDCSEEADQPVGDRIEFNVHQNWLTEITGINR